ncbi:MAG: thiamine pyrophosphate-binding protein [Candidatus Jordarchaeum sp.]|uniref:thiamine pyrophosphate-binding protein n=1 Tax=Candidatus Jordarchaeum sp. TaxID=2823881 RepID=UPI004049F3A4
MSLKRTEDIKEEKAVEKKVIERVAVKKIETEPSEIGVEELKPKYLEMSERREWTGGELLLSCLAQEKVRYIFGVVGGQWVTFMDALYREGENLGIKYIGTRHEQAAGHMADAYARLTGKPGVCLGTVGPGAADLIPGVYPAYADSIPMVVLTVQNQTWKCYPDYGSSQGCDQLSLFKSVVKWNAMISHWKRIPQMVQQAFRTATAGQPGPVHLDIPVDILFEMGSLEDVRIVPPERYRAIKPATGDPDLVKRAAKMLVEAKFPLIHCGGGVLRSRASQEIAELAEHLGAVVTGTAFARDALSDDNPLYFATGNYGGVAAKTQADTVLVVGSSLSVYDFWGKPPGWKSPEEQKFIQVDIDPEMIGLNRDVDLPIVGDAKSTLRAIINEVKRLTGKKTPNPAFTALRQAAEMQIQGLKELMESDVKPIHPLRVAKEVRDFFPKNAISILDGGNIIMWYTFVHRVYEPGTHLQALDSGHLGVGLPYAIGAKLTDPKRPVYAICGDGAFMFNIQELETATRLEVPFVVIVMNDRTWGMIKSAQRLNFGDRFIGVDFFDVRYDLVAQAMGCYGERVEDPKEIRPALERAVKSNKPAVLDVIIDKEVNLAPPGLEFIYAMWLEGCEVPKIEEKSEEGTKVKEDVKEVA